MPISLYSTPQIIQLRSLYFEFNDWGIYTIYLKDTSGEGCGMNMPMALRILSGKQLIGSLCAL